MKVRIDPKQEPDSKTFCKRHNKKKTLVTGDSLNCEDCWNNVRAYFLPQKGKTK